MTNMIRRLRIATRSLSPVEASVVVAAETEMTTPTTEIRGRLVGPTCAYATTIEVAYPLAPFPNAADLTRRFVIPEPSFWDPISPFLYHGVVELWQDGQAVDRRIFRHGLRFAQFKDGQLRWNGRSVQLRVVNRPSIVEADLPALRRDGVNAIVLDGSNLTLLEACERIGFIAIVRLNQPVTLLPAESITILGWLMPDNWRENAVDWREWLLQCNEPVGQLVDRIPPPDRVTFLLDRDAGVLHFPKR